MCKSSSSMVVVSNGSLNSKLSVSAICMVLSWKVPYSLAVGVGVGEKHYLAKCLIGSWGVAEVGIHIAS